MHQQTERNRGKLHAGYRRRMQVVLLLAGLLVLPSILATRSGTGDVLGTARAFAAEESSPEYVSAWPCDIGDTSLELDFAEQRMLEAVNGYRASLGLPQLEPTPVLQRVARWKAGSLAAQGLEVVHALLHDDPDGRTWDQRFLDCGYPAAASFAENLAAGNERIEDVIEAWRLSPTHARNLHDPVMRYAGVARARVGSLDGVPVFVWVLDFGSEP